MNEVSTRSALRLRTTAPRTRDQVYIENCEARHAVHYANSVPFAAATLGSTLHNSADLN